MTGEDEEKQKTFTLSEVKISTATAIAAAFGFVIALIWKEMIMGILVLAGLWNENGPTNWTDAGITIASSVFITAICVFGIIWISKWGKGKKN